MATITNKRLQKALPVWKQLPEAKEREFYKLLINHNYTEAAIQIGLDAHYEGAGLRGAAYQLYKYIDPDKLGIDKELQDLVREAIEKRKSTGGKPVQMSEKGLDLPSAEVLDPTDTKGVVLGGRNKAAMLLHKKMDYLSTNKKALNDTSISQLATVFGIFFDKSQVLQGQATENIAVMSKNISDDMTPEEMLEATLKMREATIIEKSEK